MPHAKFQIPGIYIDRYFFNLVTQLLIQALSDRTKMLSSVPGQKPGAELKNVFFENSVETSQVCLRKISERYLIQYRRYPYIG